MSGWRAMSGAWGVRMVSSLRKVSWSAAVSSVLSLCTSVRDGLTMTRRDAEEGWGWGCGCGCGWQRGGRVAAAAAAAGPPPDAHKPGIADNQPSIPATAIAATNATTGVFDAGLRRLIPCIPPIVIKKPVDGLKPCNSHHAHDTPHTESSAGVASRELVTSQSYLTGCHAGMW